MVRSLDKQGTIRLVEEDWVSFIFKNLQSYSKMTSILLGFYFYC
jgi:hypothetical protein